MTTQTPTPEAQLDLPPGYRFVEPIGSGGVAQLVLVERVSDGRLLALKRPLEKTENFEKLAAREVALTGSLSYPGVPRVTALHADDAGAGLIMPYLRGVTLEEAGPPAESAAALNTISALATLLFYLQLRGVIHGDFKPHNIILPEGYNSSRLAGSDLFYPRLIDFSMGDFADHSLGGSIGVGTLGYAAPETTRSGEISPQSDIFSLGAIAYWLLAGRRPFLEDKRDPAEIAAAVRETTQTPLCEIDPHIGEDLSTLVDRMLAKEPGMRPRSGFEICGKLKDCGATYPFTQAIHPRHLLGAQEAIDVATLAELPGLNLPARNELHNISGGNRWKIRLILDANFRTGKLVWQDGEIKNAPGFKSYLWPARLRRRERREFLALSLTEAKWVVKCAITGGVQRLTRILEPPPNLRPAIATSSLVELLRPELNSDTMTTQSLALAEKLANSDSFESELELCATLYLQARRLKRGLKLTLKWCDKLAQENREIEALPLLDQAETLAEDLGRTDKLIQALHRDGDIRKAVGDILGAETRYLRLLALAGDTPTRTVAETYKDLGDLYRLKKEFDSGIAALEKARELYTEFDDQAELARVTNNIGNIYWVNAEHGKALKAYRESLGLHRLREDAGNVSSTLNNIGVIYASTGRIPRAARVFTISLVIKRRLGDKEEIARTLNNLGYTHYCLGEVAKALELLHEALQLNREIGSRKEIIFNLDNLVSCEITAGRFSDALSEIREGRQLALESQDIYFKTMFDLYLAVLLKRMGHWNHARSLIQRCLKTADSRDDDTLILRSNLHLADSYRRAGDFANSAGPADLARELALKLGDKHAEIQALLLQPHERIPAIEKALRLARQVKSPRDQALVQLALADERLTRGETDMAAKALNIAGAYFESAAEDIDHPWYWRVYGQIALSSGKAKRLSETLEAALEKTLQSGEKAESWKLGVVLAESCIRSGEFEKAYSALRFATRTSRELLAELLDKLARKEFLADIFVQKIGSQISALKGKMSVA
ncbi:MAG: tetratricopeptide repeat protein [Candidatus Zixiibacteriota bacterium]